MFDSLLNLLQNDATKLRGFVIVGCLFTIFALLLWISWIDIKKQSITFWKMLIASSSTIIMPIIASFFYNCSYLKWFYVGALIIWILFLYFNIKYNNDKFVGKADIDLLSAIFAECIMFSAWLITFGEKDFIWIKITHLWYSFFLYILIGAVFYVALFLTIFSYKAFIKKEGKIKDLIRSTKISVIPMLVPVSIMMPYTFMIIQ